jgi:hypothetical protein
MAAWERYAHADAPDRLAQLAILHAEFEALHPFLDGNGRLGRLLVPLFLLQTGLIQPCRVLRLSGAAQPGGREGRVLTLTHGMQSRLPLTLDTEVSGKKSSVSSMSHGLRNGV